MSASRPSAVSNQPESQGESSSGKVTSEGTSFSGGTSGSSGGVGGGTPQNADGGSGGGGDGGRGRKRRAVGSVSLMACTPCRQARQRCDGQRPDTCSRCLQRKLDCVYEPHTKTHKDDLIREIETLREDNVLLQARNREIEEAAAKNDQAYQSLREEGKSHRIILETIGNNGHDREIINRLRAGESHQGIADWLVRETPTLGNQPITHHKLVDVVGLFETRYGDPDSHHSREDRHSSWTNVTTSQKFISHLLNLYFTWVHPVHMLFSESAFRHDFEASQERCCSASLVNAMCAMACNLLETETHDLDGRNTMDSATLRDSFMKEARSFLLPESFRLMPSIQTFAVMFLVELSSGKARNGMAYLRSAVDNVRSAEMANHSEEEKELTLWGIMTLNSVCAGMTYQKLYSPPMTSEQILPYVRLDRDGETWRFYRRLGDEQVMPPKTSHATITICYQARLFRIIQDNLNLYCGKQGRISAYKVLEVYRRYLDWRESLPPVIANISESDQPLPHILQLHVQYHTALVQLFRPLVHGSFFLDSDGAEMRRIVVFHARSGVEPIGHAQRLYSARYLLPLVTFCLVHLCDTLLSYSPQEPPASETMAFCLQALQQNHAGFAVCSPLQSLFVQRAEECGVRIPQHLEKLVDSIDNSSMDEILDACTRLTYMEPLDQIVQYIDPSIATEWNEEWEIQIIGRKRRREPLQIGNILND